MRDLVAISEDIVRGNLLVVDGDVGSVDGVFVVLGRVGLELLDEGREQRLAYPPAFGEGFVGVGVGFDEAEGEAVDVFGLLLFLLFVLLHLPKFSFIIEVDTKERR
jgi:hypothetical protein